MERLQTGGVSSGLGTAIHRENKKGTVQKLERPAVMIFPQYLRVATWHTCFYGEGLLLC